jgi:hypothetical protein
LRYRHLLGTRGILCLLVHIDLALLLYANQQILEISMHYFMSIVSKGQHQSVYSVQQGREIQYPKAGAWYIHDASQKLQWWCTMLSKRLLSVDDWVHVIATNCMDRSPF